MRNPKPKNRSTGDAGEDIAAHYLVSHGYYLLNRNYRGRYGELDIVAQKDSTICFIEVKTRTSNRFGMPYEAVTAVKQRHMIGAAHEYLLTHPHSDLKMKCLVISILLSPGKPEQVSLYEL